MKPSIEVIGLYEVPSDESSRREEIDTFYASLGSLDDTVDYRRRLLSLVLFEVTISGGDETFNVGDFTQEAESAPRGAWQVAYLEVLLSTDGRRVLRQGQGCADGIAHGRLCFYFHHYDPLRPMMWTYGEFVAPAAVTPRKGIFELARYSAI